MPIVHIIENPMLSAPLIFVGAISDKYTGTDYSGATNKIKFNQSWNILNLLYIKTWKNKNDINLYLITISYTKTKQYATDDKHSNIDGKTIQQRTNKEKQATCKHWDLASKHSCSSGSKERRY